MKKFNELYKLIMEECTSDKEYKRKFWNLLSQISHAPSQQYLTYIY